MGWMYPKTVTACDLFVGDRFVGPGGKVIEVCAATEELLHGEFNERYVMNIVDQDGVEYQFPTYAQFDVVSLEAL